MSTQTRTDTAGSAATTTINGVEWPRTHIACAITAIALLITCAVLLVETAVDASDVLVALRNANAVALLAAISILGQLRLCSRIERLTVLASGDARAEVAELQKTVDELTRRIEAVEGARSAGTPRSGRPKRRSGSAAGRAARVDSQGLNAVATEAFVLGRRIGQRDAGDGAAGGA